MLIKTINKVVTYLRIKRMSCALHSICFSPSHMRYKHKNALIIKTYHLFLSTALGFYCSVFWEDMWHIGEAERRKSYCVCVRFLVFFACVIIRAETIERTQNATCRTFGNPLTTVSLSVVLRRPTVSFSSVQTEMIQSGLNHWNWKIFMFIGCFSCFFCFVPLEAVKRRQSIVGEKSTILSRSQQNKGDTRGATQTSYQSAE